MKQALAGIAASLAESAVWPFAQAEAGIEKLAQWAAARAVPAPRAPFASVGAPRPSIAEVEREMGMPEPPLRSLLRRIQSVPRTAEARYAKTAADIAQMAYAAATLPVAVKAAVKRGPAVVSAVVTAARDYGHRTQDVGRALGEALRAFPDLRANVVKGVLRSRGLRATETVDLLRGAMDAAGERWYLPGGEPLHKIGKEFDSALVPLVEDRIEPGAIMSLLKKESEEGTRAVAGFDPRLVPILGKNLYSGDLGVIAMKEMLQNAVDAVRPKGSSGLVQAFYDSAQKMFAVVDNGAGMTPEVAMAELVDIGGSRKDIGASGGFGIAKVAIFSNAEDIRIATVAQQGGRKVKTVLTGSAEDWLDASRGLRVETSEVPAEEPTYTLVRVKLKPDAPANYFRIKNWLQNFIDVSALPVQTKVVVDGRALSPMAPTLERVADITGAGATAKVFVSPDLVRDRRFEAHVLNNGLFQFNMEHYVVADSDVPLPVRVVVDVRPHGPPDAPDYPFRPDREGLRGDMLDRIRGFFHRDIVGVAMEQEARQLRDYYRRAPLIPGTRYKALDTTGGFPEEFLTRVASHPNIVALSRAMERVLRRFDAVRSKVFRSGAQRARFGGIALGVAEGPRRVFAFNLSTKTLLGEPVPNEIFINPLTVLREAAYAVETGRVKESEVGRYLAGRLTSILVHEMAHDFRRSHGEEFASWMTEFTGALISEGRLSSASRYLERVVFGGKGMESWPNWRRDVDEYVRAWEDAGRTDRNLLAHVTSEFDRAGTRPVLGAGLPGETAPPGRGLERVVQSRGGYRAVQ